MTYYGIYINGKLDDDPEPMIFNSHEEAVEFYDHSNYDPDITDICVIPDYIAVQILRDWENGDYERGAYRGSERMTQHCEGCPECVVLFDEAGYHGSVPDSHSATCEGCPRRGVKS